MAHGFISPSIIGVGDDTVDIIYTGPNGERIIHTVSVRGYDTFDDRYQPSAYGTWAIMVR